MIGRRESIRNELLIDLMHDIRLCCGQYSKNWNLAEKEKFMSCLAAINESNLWPFNPTRSIEAMLAQLPCKPLAKLSNWPDDDMRLSAELYVGDIRSHVHGVCLDCVRGKNHARVSACHIPSYSKDLVKK